MSNKPREPKPSEESPTGVSHARKPAVGETKEHAGQVRAPVPTQGHSKALQRLEDLWQNEEFRAELVRIQRIQDPDWRNKQLFRFAEAHSLDYFSGSSFVQLLVTRHFWFREDPGLDFCQLVDEVDEILENSEHDYYVTLPKPNRDKRLSIMLYPIHICISPLASKRDVLDYVAKKWGDIRSLLDIYREGEPTIRKRRKAARDQFIWEHRDVPSTELADTVCKEFPNDEPLTYADVNSIKHKLRQRHSKL